LRAATAAVILGLWWVLRFAPIGRLTLLVWATVLAISGAAWAIAHLQRGVLTPLVIGILVTPLTSSFVHLPRRAGLPLFVVSQLLCGAIPVAWLWAEISEPLRPMAVAGTGANLLMGVLAALNAARLRELRERQLQTRDKLERAHDGVSATLSRDQVRLREVEALLQGLSSAAEVLRESVLGLRREGEGLAAAAMQLQAGLESTSRDGRQVSQAGTAIDALTRGSQSRLEELDRRDREEGATSRKQLVGDAEAIAASAQRIAQGAEAVVRSVRQSATLALNASVEAPRLGLREVDALAVKMRGFSSEGRARSGRIAELAKALLASACRLEREARLYSQQQDQAALGPRQALAQLELVAERASAIRSRATEIDSATRRQGECAGALAGVAQRLKESTQKLDSSAQELYSVARGLAAFDATSRAAP
ncbi:MAG: methyl-accepting chemotaxis protein, partial [Deltaproteobacteria bacterium]|nr:methyl-accepting chemotaxis protein [Deltaproteobacteria bacterium]